MEYQIITPNSFKPERIIIANTEFTFDDERVAIKSQGLEIPTELKILAGYRKPEYSDIGGGYQEFKNWVNDSLKTDDAQIIIDSICFLRLKEAYYEWLDSNDEALPADDRIWYRLQEGRTRLCEGLSSLLIS